MIPLATFRELFEYNYWARDRQLEACAPLTPEQFLRPLGSSYSSLRDTLAHLLGVEWLYAERLQGRSPARLPLPEEFSALAEVSRGWRDVEREMRAQLGQLTDDLLAQPHSFSTMRGQTRTQARWETLYHLLNHQSYHRGQVTTMLRQLGARPAPVDYYVYLDARKG